MFCSTAEDKEGEEYFRSHTIKITTHSSVKNDMHDASQAFFRPLEIFLRPIFEMPKTINRMNDVTSTSGALYVI